MVEYELKGLFNQNTLSTSDISNNNNLNFPHAKLLVSL